VATRQRVRLDVAAVIGLAERGPVNTPVVIDDARQFEAIFGRALPGLQLLGGAPVLRQRRPALCGPVITTSAPPACWFGFAARSPRRQVHRPQPAAGATRRCVPSSLAPRRARLRPRPHPHSPDRPAVGATLRLTGRPFPGATRSFLPPPASPSWCPRPPRPSSTPSCSPPPSSSPCGWTSSSTANTSRPGTTPPSTPATRASCRACWAAGPPAKPCCRPAPTRPTPKTRPPRPTACGAAPTSRGVPTTCAPAPCSPTPGASSPPGLGTRHGRDATASTGRQHFFGAATSSVRPPPGRPPSPPAPYGTRPSPSSRSRW
jgi:hypothetical protein